MYLWLVLCSKATEHKKETNLQVVPWLRLPPWSGIPPSFIPYLLHNTQLKMALNPAAAIRLCIAVATRPVCLGWMEKVCSSKSTWSECLQCVQNSEVILRSLLNNIFLFLFVWTIRWSLRPLCKNKRILKAWKHQLSVICRTLPLSGKIFATMCPKQMLLGHSRLRKKFSL